MTVHPSDLPEPVVLWALPLSHARDLYERLNYNRPAGYPTDLDALAEAIVMAESVPRRTTAGYIEVRSPESILAQFRNCVEEAEAAKGEDEWGLVAMHNQNATDSAIDLDNLLSDNKSVPLPTDWQRS